MKRVIAGPRAVVESLQSDASRVAVVYVASDKVNRSPLKEICEQAQRVRVRYEEREPVDLDQMAGGQRHQGVLAIAGEYVYTDLESLVPADKPYPLLVALDQITDPHNFGAIVRSAVAFGADGIVILKDRSVSVTASVVRASAGATEYARIARVTNLVRALQQWSERGLQIVGLDGSASQQLDSLVFPSSGRVLVVGSEGKGIRRLVREHCDSLARIELAGPIASLNASVAAAIALYQSERQRQR